MDVTKRYGWKVFLAFEDYDQVKYLQHWIKKSRLKYSGVFAFLFKVDKRTVYDFIRTRNLIDFDRDNNSNEADKNFRLFKEQMYDVPCICMNDIKIDFNKRYSFKTFVHMDISTQRRYIAHLMKMYPSVLNTMNLALFFRTKYMNVYNYCKRHNISSEKSKYIDINVQNRFRMDLCIHDKLSKIHDICGDVIFDCDLNHAISHPQQHIDVDIQEDSKSTVSDIKTIDETVPADIPKEVTIETDECDVDDNNPELTSDNNNCTISTVSVTHIKFTANVHDISEFLLRLGFNKNDKLNVSIEKIQE
nr:MAG TPA: hypothetical protein [Caudoviricetes sp.]